MKINRREFAQGLAAAGGACFLGGCRAWCGAGKKRIRDYFCTWETQRALWKGRTCERDNMNEEVLFGKNGWVGLFPDARSKLIIVLDDGEIAGIGTHEELLSGCTVYQEIYYSQYPKADMVSASEEGQQHSSSKSVEGGAVNV